MSLVKFVKGDTTSLNSTYRRQGTGNIEFDSTTKKIYLDGVNYTGEVDSELTQNSNNPVSSSALYKVITENELTTAAALTEHENRLDGLDETIAEKQDTLTFDTTPTANSNNPVTSGGIKTYIDNNSPLKVTITYSQIAGAETYLSDKTYSVIQTAITNGRVVKLYYNNKEFDLKSIDSNEVIFERNENDNTYTRIKITNAEYVQVTTGTTLVSGTNIKTINSTSLLGSGDIAVQTPLVSGTDIKTINDQSLLGSGNLDLNPLIFITFWQTDRPTVSSSGQYWYNSQYNTLQLYNGSKWTAVTLSQQKLYIRLATNEIYRYDGREMVRMTLNPTSIVTT